MNKLRDDAHRFQQGEITLNQFIDGIIEALPNKTEPGDVMQKRVAHGYNIAIHDITMMLWETKIPWET